MKKEKLIIWGKHPAHCNGAWIKLADNRSQKQRDQLRADGWTIDVLKTDSPAPTW